MRKDKSANIVLQLLKVFLGNSGKVDYDISKLNWADVIDFATRQGVLGVCFEAFDRLPNAYRPDLDNLMQWLGQVEYMKTVYRQYEDTIKQLGDLMSYAGLKMMVMKGYGCSLNYPNPQMRPCGDIDIWMFDNQKEADEVIRNNGIEVNSDNEHHSVFSFNGFTVENHKTILDANVHKSSRYLNELLENFAMEETYETEIDGCKVSLPSTKFNSVHLLRHMASDFATVTTSLRHVLDWSTFVATHDVDWRGERQFAHKSNMNRFLDAVNGICVHHLGYSEDLFPIENDDRNLEDRVLKDILYNVDLTDRPIGKLSLVEKIKYSYLKTTRLLRNNWKYQIVYNESLLESFSTLASNRLKKFI